MEAWIRNNPQHDGELRGLMNTLKGFIIGHGDKNPATFGKLCGQYKTMLDEEIKDVISPMRLSIAHIQYFLIGEGLASLAKNIQNQYVFVPVRNAETRNILDMKSRDKTTKTRKMPYQYISGNPFPAPNVGGASGRPSAFASQPQPERPMSTTSTASRKSMYSSKSGSKPMQKTPYIRKSEYQSGGGGVFNPLTGKVEYPSSTPAPSAATATRPTGMGRGLVRASEISHPQESKPQPARVPPRPTAQEVQPQARVPPAPTRRPPPSEPVKPPTQTVRRPLQTSRVPPMHPGLAEKQKAKIVKPNDQGDSTASSDAPRHYGDPDDALAKFRKKLTYIISRHPLGLSFNELASCFRNKHSEQLKSFLTRLNSQIPYPIEILRKYSERLNIFVGDEDIIYPQEYSPQEWKKTVFEQISDLLGEQEEPEDILKVEEDYRNRFPVDYKDYHFYSFYEFIMHLGDIALIEIDEDLNERIGKNYLSMKETLVKCVMQLVYRTEKEGKDLQISSLRRKFRLEFSWDIPMSCFSEEYEEELDIERLAYLLVNHNNKKNVMRIDNGLLKLKSKADLRAGLANLKAAAPLKTRFAPFLKPSVKDKFYVTLNGEVNSCDEIWVMRQADLNKLTNLVQELSEVCKGYKRAGKNAIENEILPGCAVAVFDGDYWLRGEVVEYADDHECPYVVRYVDFGTIECFGKENIQWLDEKFIKLRRLSFPISILSDVNPDVISKDEIDEINEQRILQDLVGNLDSLKAGFLFECTSADASGFQGFKGRIKVKTETAQCDLLSKVHHYYKKRNSEERSESEETIRTSDNFPSINKLEPPSPEKEEDNIQPKETRAHDTSDDETKEGEFLCEFIYPPEDATEVANVYIAEHVTFVNIDGQLAQMMNVVLISDEDKLAVSFESLSSIFIKLLAGVNRVRGRVWLKKVTAKGVVNINVESIKEKMGVRISDEEQEQLSKQLDVWGLKGAHPENEVDESAKDYAFILWDDLWRAFCKARTSENVPPFITKTSTVFEAIHRMRTDFFDGDV
ncbi:Oidioi.mRNA.OKI2018_I69.PAR.g13001.t1.cds [Oikopleura dioica]|uniref:Oidioi.mRNA.OKI2018_I69.PAR.g13001.t1.cds n=1 Tax=Oikopleura dioica TaxID=34765 RepID=A0ABN7S8U4_OIKDI|nr:Oidioi.mRNA.OKI2018_I69.PAR.g13001.t1.cds [Oikopleura dioica]